MTQENSIPIIRILKIGACPNLSGKSNLGYHIGYSPESEICFRVVSNSGGGYFSPEWVLLTSIREALDKAPKPITSFSLSALFRGKSVNTPSFLFAALLAEGLVQRDEENLRCYIVMPPDAFMADILQLIEAGTDLKAPQKISGKGVVKSSGNDVVPTLSSPSRGRPKKAKS